MYKYGNHLTGGLTEIAPAVGGEERDRWAGPALLMETGLNPVALRSVNGSGVPAVPPGRHTVWLSGEGMQEMTEVVVEREPQSTDLYGLRIRRSRPATPDPIG